MKSNKGTVLTQTGGLYGSPNVGRGIDASYSLGGVTIKSDPYSHSTQLDTPIKINYWLIHLGSTLLAGAHEKVTQSLGMNLGTPKQTVGDVGVIPTHSLHLGVHIGLHLRTEKPPLSQGAGPYGQHDPESPLPANRKRSQHGSGLVASLLVSL